MCNNRGLNQSQTFEIGSVPQTGCQDDGHNWVCQLTITVQTPPSPAQPSEQYFPARCRHADVALWVSDQSHQSLGSHQSTTRMPFMIARHFTIRTSMTIPMLAWHRTMRTPLTTSTERERAFSQVVLSCLHPHTHMHLGSSLSLSCHLHVHGHPCGLFTLILPFDFLLYLPHLVLFLNYLKSVVNLHTPPNESMDSTDEFSLSTGYESKAHDFYETTVEPYVQLLDSPPLFSNKVSSADPD